MEASDNKVPKHVAIILDGNRRFAKKLMLKPWKGHEWGAEKVEKLFDWCVEEGVEELTLYSFSHENFNRPEKEFNFLMDLFEKEFSKFKNDPRIEKYDIKVNFIGRIEKFPEKVKKHMHELINKTKDNKGFILNFAMAYGGRQEVIDAVRKIGEKIKNNELDINEINEEVFEKELYMNDEPELIIRTGGERRSSNFLMWQSPYSEWIYLDKTWPEFDRKDFVECLEEFSDRERRFGK